MSDKEKIKFISKYCGVNISSVKCDKDGSYPIFSVANKFQQKFYVFTDFEAQCACTELYPDWEENHLLLEEARGMYVCVCACITNINANYFYRNSGKSGQFGTTR